MDEPYTLDVYYPTDGPGAFDWGSIDGPIEELVGKASTGSGTDADGGDRDLTFSFDSMDDVEAAASRVDAEIPSLKYIIFDWTTADPPTRSELSLEG